MVQASEIVSEETLKAWLDARPEETRQRDAVIIAHRSAMRVLPLYIQVLDDAWARKSGLTALPVLRADLTSGAYAGKPAKELKEAAVAARTGASHDAFTARSSPHTSNAAADAAISAAAAAAAAAKIDTAYTFSAPYVDRAYATVRTSASDTSIWSTLRVDASELEASQSPHTGSLWPTEPPDELQRLWTKSRDWLAAHPGHDFWIRWYDAALEGRPLTGDWDSHWQLLTDIALIPEEDWEKGAEHIAGLIDKIEDKYRPKHEPIVRPALLQVSVTEVRQALKTNRLTLPPTFDAIYGQIDLEIRRLQGINYWPSDAEREEALALIRRLTAMAEAVQELRQSVDSASEEPTVQEAEKTKTLLELYVGHLKSWPRENAADLTDSVWRLGLTGLSVAGLTVCGVALPMAITISGMFFGSKKLTEAIKAGSSSKSVIGS